MSELKISVALATFNGARYLQDQLDSLAAQMHQPTELVVTDDGSTDTTLALLQRFAEQAPFSVKIHCNQERLGYGMNFLKAASLCTGDAVAFCDQDDVWLPVKLQKLAQAFDLHHADFVAHAAEVTDSDLKPAGKLFPDIAQDACFGADEVHEAFYPGFSTAVSRRLMEHIKQVVRCPGFVTEAHDELICDLAATGWRRCELSQTLVLYRQHEANLIGYHGAVLRQKVA